LGDIWTILGDFWTILGDIWTILGDFLAESSSHTDAIPKKEASVVTVLVLDRCSLCEDESFF
jgi:hypothetical protein